MHSTPFSDSSQFSDFRAFEVTQGISAVILPDSPKYTCIAVSEGFVATYGIAREAVRGRGYFEVFPQSTGDLKTKNEQRLRASFAEVITQKLPHTAAFVKQEEDSPGKKYLSFLNTPVLSDAGELMYIVHSMVEAHGQNAAVSYGDSQKSIRNIYDLFMSAPAIIGILRDANYIIELANDNLLEVWARTSEVIGKPLLEAIPELKGQGYIELLDAVRRTGQPYYATEAPIFLVRDGKEELRYFDFVYKPFYEDAKETVADRVIAVGYDVTEQVRSRIKVQQSEQKYRRLFEFMDQGYCTIEIIFDEKGKCVDYRFLEVNPAFDRHSGLTNSLGKTIRELTPGIESYWFDLYGKVAITGEPVRVVKESEALNKWFDIYAIRVGNGDNYKVGVFFTDITDRKKADEAVRLSQERLEKAISIETVGVIFFDLDGVIHDANVAFERMSGYTRTDLVSGKVRWDVLTPPEFMDVTLRSREEFLTKWQNTPYEKQYLRPDGSRWWGLFAGKRLSETECVEFVVDITKAKEAEEELEKKVKERTAELERRNQELEQFAYVSHHDLQEPLRKITIFTEMVQSESFGVLGESSRKRLEKVSEAAHRMSIALRDVLNFASLSKEEQFVNINLTDIIETVKSDLELLIQEKNAKIEFGQLPSLKAVPAQMHQLFYNLVTNALKFSKADESPVIQITSRKLTGTELAAHGGLDMNMQFYEIAVRDNGIGFDPASGEKIFSMFQRLHSKNAYAGTGIGLALCRKVVQNHRGKIWSESAPGQGATFKILLPANY